MTELPINLDYRLRFPSESRTPTLQIYPKINNWYTNLLYPRFKIGGPRGAANFSSGWQPFYYNEGFIAIQDAIARSYTRLKCGNSCKNGIMPSFFLQRFPYPSYIQDSLMNGLEVVLTFFILLSFLYTVINTVRFIAIENENQLKEAMKIMGLPNWLHWTSWFVRTMTLSTICISLMVGLLKVMLFFFLFVLLQI